MSAHKLVIVESPAKAHTIGKYLGSSYKVIASQGHVRDLPKSQLGIDVDNGFEPKYINIRGRGDIIRSIREEAKKASTVLLATDPDREGEAISWHLATMLDIDPKQKCRIEFNEITSGAVKAAVKNPRALNLTLVDAQQARRVLDRLVGYKLSPLLWAKVRKGLSAGRVQSVATAMVVEREQQISDFEPEEYWLVDGVFKAGRSLFNARFYGFNGEKADLKNENDALSVLASCKGKDFTVKNIKKADRRKYPAAPFTTSSMQQEASRKLNFGASKTMQIAQQLYEGVDIKKLGAIGLISYMRTDSTRISEEAAAACRELLLSKFDAAYVPETYNVYKSRAGAQDAHEAIRPTDVKLAPADIKDSLTGDQYKLYKLVYDRFVASQMTPAVYDTQTADLICGNVTFHHASQTLRFPGFTAVYEEGQDEAVEKDDTKMPALSEGETVSAVSVTPSRHFTQPPARYTEASLVRALEEKGIGRPSTYAPTISTITERGYVAKEKKQLYPTELGSIVTEMMLKSFPDIVDKQFTADMETKLDRIEEGELNWKNVIAEFYAPFSEELSAAEGTLEKVKIEDEVSDVPCDKCGAMMVYKNGRFGRFLACPNFPACRNTKTLLTLIEAPCPVCGKPVAERMNRKGRKFFGCTGYPDCSFVSWDKPAGVSCPECGSYMVIKRGKNGSLTHVCSSENCTCRIEVASGDGDENE